MTMSLRLIVPSGIIFQGEAVKITAEAANGSFCLLPRHIDFVASLVPGILSIALAEGEEVFVAVDEGVLVKHGREVRVSTWNAVQGQLGELRDAVRARSAQLGEREQQARRALDRLEASLVRGIVEWDGGEHG